MKTIRLFLLPIFYFLAGSIGLAQQAPDFNCGFDDLRNPAQTRSIESFEEQLRLYFSQKNEADFFKKGLSGLPYVVPVVVHIIHDGGTENISDTRVLAAIDHLNEGFAAQGYFAQQGATVNSQIQFCLAKRDPDGNATTGITRTQSSLTNMVMETEDIPTKDLSRWNPKDYVNIWVVREISSVSLGSGVAGYAYFPSSHGQPEDGMICEARTFGVSPAMDAVLIHEMGHYFGLYHTFEGGCQNSDCTVNGDRVCDTPPDNATHTTCPYNSCVTDIAPGSPFTADVNDFTNDFMDYSPFSCYHIFTAGQAVRMQGSVETVRKSLLTSKRCLNPCSQPLLAAFSAVPNPVFAGQPIAFTSNSTGATNFSWSENGSVFSQNQNPTKVFTTIGNYLISLKITNSDPNCEDTTQLVVQVVCPIEANFSVVKYEVMPGETLVFTNTSTGGATGYEWSVNGFTLATTPNFSSPFSNPGYYTVKLLATGTACSKEKIVLIHVKSPCGDPVNVQTQFTNAGAYLIYWDMVALPDGSTIQVGRINNQPMMTRLDAGGNILWHKAIDGPGSFNDIEPLPNGQFIIHAMLNDKLILAKMDAGGNFFWFKALDNPLGNFGGDTGPGHLAVNPDGSFFFFFRGDSGFGGVGKASNAGAVLWLRRLNSQDATSGMQIIRDGSNDLLMTSFSALFGTELVVNRISQTGNLVDVYKYDLTQVISSGGHAPYIGTHADGDFSLIFELLTTPSFTLGDKYIIRARSNGQPRWAKKMASTGSTWSTLSAQYWPDEGWLLSDFKNTSDHYMLRLNDAGDLLWQRKIGTGGWFGDDIFASVRQNGLIRALQRIKGDQKITLLQTPDAYSPIPCLPDIPKTETVTMTPVVMAKIQPTVTNLNYALIPESFSFLEDATLQRAVLCTAVFPCPEACDNQLDDDGDGYVDCFDADCPCFDSDTACLVSGPVNNFTAKRSWESAINDASVSAVPIVANLNPQQDSIPEIIVFPSSADVTIVNAPKLLIFKGDGSNAANPNVLAVPAGLDGYPAGNPTVADLDHNGVPEVILVTADGKIRVFTDFDPAANPCMKQWVVSAQSASSGNARAYVADFNSDGIGEIFAGNDVFKLDLSNPAAPVLTKVLDGFGAHGLLGWGNNTQTAESVTAADLLSKADCNGDPDCDGLEIAAGYQIFSIDIDLTDGDGYQIKIQRDLNILDANHTHSDGYTAVADLNFDGIPEVIVSGQRDNASGLYVWNKNGLVQDFTNPDFSKVYGMVCVANVFDDKTAGFVQDFPELIACNGSGILCLNLQKAQATPAQPYWWVQSVVDASSLTGATVFDFNGDGHAEIVYRDEQFLRIMYGGPTPFPAGVDVQRNWYRVIAGSGTFDEYPVIADLDNDGEAEIAVTSFLFPGNNSIPEDYRGRLRIFKSANLPWLPARPIWNQYNYFGVNINDDLSVPKTQQKHWLEMGGTGSGKRPFNTHLAQVSSFNPLNNNKLKAPDARITLDSTRCQMDSFAVYLNICNLGSAALPNGTPIAFYKGNPTTTNAALLFPPILIPEKIENGACENIKLTIPATYGQSIFVVVNDDGSLPRPFNLATSFPATDQPECHYENNLTSFAIFHPTPLLDLGPDLAICKNSVIELLANPNFQQYRWQDGSTARKFTAYLPGKYWVDVTDACGFRQSDTVNIVLNTLYTLDLPDSLTICGGEPIALAASGFSKYTWSPADSVSCANCATVDILAQKSITLYLTAAVGDCFVSDSVRIKISPKPAVDLLAKDGNCNAPASIAATVSGAAPFDFQWSNSSTDSVLTTTQSGTYTVEITDNNGCRTTDSATVSVENTLKVLATPMAPVCANSLTGAVDLTVSGGVPPFQFLWSNSATTEDLINSKSGTYSVVVTDANGCTATISETLTDPPALVLSLQKTDPKCAGAASGALDLTASGGTGNLQFVWSNNTTTEDLTTTPAGTYSVQTTDTNGCTAAIAATLTDPPVLALSLQKSDPKCAGTASGALDLTASGGTGNLQFIWSNNTTTEDLTTTPAGTYSVQATDANGCTAAISGTLIDPPVLVLNLQKTNPKCAGQSSGALDLTASGGTGSLQFVWSNNTTTEDLTATLAGIYSVQATDANGCTAAILGTLTDPPALALSLKKIDPKCAGTASGALDLTTSGGTGNLQFVWSNNATTEDLTTTLAGTYSVQATDANGCTAAISGTLTDPPALALSLQKTDSKCAGTASGALDLTASGGTGNLQFVWSNNATTEDLTATLAGTYSVQATDANGCTATISETLTDPPVLILSLQKTDPTCAGTASGALNLTASGGTGNLQFVWSNNTTTEDLTATAAGTYSVLTTDANGCTAVISGTLTDPPALLLSLQKTDPTCAGTASGALDLTASGGTGNLQFVWSNNTTTEDLTATAAGTYSVQATDANGCTAAISGTLTDPPALLLSLQKTDPKCAGAASGALDLTASGGTGNLQFAWSNNATSEDLTATAAGTYSVQATDANGCTAAISGTLTDPPILTLTLLKTDLNCPGDLGLIDLTAGGGTPPFAFLWSNGAATEDINITQPGTYTVFLTDANGCKITETALITTLGTAPVLNLTTDTLTCQNNSGVISVTSNLANTSFLWSGPGSFSSTASTPVITVNGAYSVTATLLSGGCTSVGTVFVPIDTIPPTAIIPSDSITIPCDQSSIAIAAAGSSNGSNFTIDWTGGSILSGANTLSPAVGSAGLYNLLITNVSNGCTATDAVEVVQVAIPTTTATADSVRCFGEINGSIRVNSISGGIPPLTYSIDNQNFTTNPVFENLAAGIYSVYVRDANGCTSAVAVEVAQPAPIAVDLTGDSLVVQGATAHLQAIVSPANFVPLQIDWSANGVDFAQQQLERSVAVVQNTIFQINVADEHGCSATDTWLVRVNEAHQVYVPNAIFPESSGGNQVFLIFAGAGVLQIESLQIFDRWGDQVFSNQHFPPNEEGQGWNGAFQGKPVNAGVFVWVAKVVFKDGTVQVLRGDLTVVR